MPTPSSSRGGRPAPTAALAPLALSAQVDRSGEAAVGRSMGQEGHSYSPVSAAPSIVALPFVTPAPQRMVARRMHFRQIEPNTEIAVGRQRETRDVDCPLRRQKAVTEEGLR